MDKVLDFVNSLNIDKNEYIVVACSGGPDSMFLLNLLNEKNYKCICAHVNHKLRKESDEEYIFVKNYCLEHDILFEGVELDGYVSGNFENYSREFRYDFFEKILNKYKAKYLFTAHHGDDLIETILMRIVRGSSLKGYAGFNSLTKKKAYYIVRPLIYLTKDYIEESNKQNNIKYVIDESNNTDDYTRNRYRHHILPFLKDEEMFVNERFLKFSTDLFEVSNYIDNIVNNYLELIYINNVLDINEFMKIDEYIQKKIINNILSKWYPDNLFLVNNNHVEEIFKIINSDKPNIFITLPNNLGIKRVYDKLYFGELEEEVNDYYYEFNDYLELDDGILKKVDESDSSSNYVIRLNSKSIKLPLVIRNRKSGDKMIVKNMDGTKKINDIFIDMKVPKDRRKSWPLVLDSDGNILWIPGIKKSHFDIPINSEYDIIITYAKKERD